MTESQPKYATNNESIKIRDMRGGDYFRMHNIIIDTYGHILQAAGIAVYATLCRMADNDDQTCYPSYQTIAKRIGLSRAKVGGSLKLLRDVGLVQWESGKQTHSVNIYTLVDPPQRVSWVDTPKEARVSLVDTTCLPGRHASVSLVDTNKTHVEQYSDDKTNKDTSSEKSSDQPLQPMVTNYDPEAVARQPERDAAWIAALESKPPPSPAPSRDADTYRAELQATEERMLARAEESHVTWGIDCTQIHARDGVSRDVIQRVGELLEIEYGLRPPWDSTPRMRNWAGGLAELYKASDGDLEMIAEAADLLRQKDYAMNKPQSLFNTVSGLAAKRRSGERQRRSERDGYERWAGTSLPEAEERTGDEALWDRILDALALTMDRGTFDHLLRDSRPTRREDGTLTVAVRNEAAVAGLGRMPAVGRCVERFEAGLRVEFEVEVVT